jgi:hypothetical protein
LPEAHPAAISSTAAAATATETAEDAAEAEQQHAAKKLWEREHWFRIE